MRRMGGYARTLCTRLCTRRCRGPQHSSIGQDCAGSSKLHVAWELPSKPEKPETAARRSSARPCLQEVLPLKGGRRAEQHAYPPRRLVPDQLAPAHQAWGPGQGTLPAYKRTALPLGELGTRPAPAAAAHCISPRSAAPHACGVARVHVLARGSDGPAPLAVLPSPRFPRFAALCPGRAPAWTVRSTTPHSASSDSFASTSSSSEALPRCSCITARPVTVTGLPPSSPPNSCCCRGSPGGGPGPGCCPPPSAAAGPLVH